MVHRTCFSSKPPDVSKGFPSEQVSGLGHQVSLVGGPRVNRFGLVSSNGYAMLLPGGDWLGERVLYKGLGPKEPQPDGDPV